MDNKPDADAPLQPAPDAPPSSSDAGLVRGDDRDVSERPQGDPEVPELGAHDPARRQLPEGDATGF